MLGIFGSIFEGDSRQADRDCFQRNGIPMPDHLMTEPERMHKFHRENFERMAEQAITQGLQIKGYRGDANGGELIVEPKTTKPI